MATKQYDFLIIGAGIAGLTYALKLSEYYQDSNKKILIITKADSVDESNTKYAQGGVAAVNNLKTDSYQKHVEDTLIAGDGLCDKKIVKLVVQEGPERIKEIINWGTQFDKKPDGKYDLAKEGGHSESRIYHFKDITGKEIERALLAQVYKAKNIEVKSHYFAIDIITQHHLGVTGIKKKSKGVKCFGVYVLNRETNEIETILSKITMLATGGVGQVYANTTNPKIATGDGIAMAYRAKATVKNMEFIQFHPTALYHPSESPSFLITEALRGAGAQLKNKAKRAFMHKYDARGSLAPRDIVARAIDAEMKRRGDSHLYLDARHINKNELLSHFPNIYAKCLSIGIDISKEMIPIVPATHYLCGGIAVNEFGQTSIEGLYASGECACTGLHGANRLASNSLLEALVFSHRSYSKACEQIDNIQYQNNVPDWDARGTNNPKELVLIQHNIQELKQFMSDYVGIVRSDIRLNRALKRLKLLYEEQVEFFNETTISVELCELRNLINVCYLIANSALERKESRGLHYTIDYPEKLVEV